MTLVLKVEHDTDCMWDPLGLAFGINFLEVDVFPERGA